MTALNVQAGDVKEKAEAAVLRAKPAIARLVRLGYAAKGAVYVVVGLLALLAAVGSRGGQTTGSRGAMKAIVGQPFGTALLLVVAAGLAAYALWQFFRAAADPEHWDDGPKSWARRVGYLGSSVIHSGLVVAALKTAAGAARSTDDDVNARGWTATFMSYPFGHWVVAGVGIGIAAFGLRQLYKAYRCELDKQLALGAMSAAAHRLTLIISRLGLAARGVVFAVIGGLLVLAALHENPSQARGLGGALDSLRSQPYGPWLLAAVAVGLVGYGVYLFIRARYRRIDLT